MDFFVSKPLNINSEDVIKEGWLVKQSKYRKIWRERWCVLTLTHLYTFKKEKVYSSPTEDIEIVKVKTVKSDESKSSSNIFHVEAQDGIYSFQAKSYEDKEGWIGALGKVLLISSKSNIFIQEEI